MITNKDLIKLATVFPTRVDLEDLRLEIEELRITKRQLLTSADNLAKAVGDLRVENKVMWNILDRHDKWIHQLSRETSVKLEVLE